MTLLDRIDHRAKGRGLAMAQIKVTRVNGDVEYHLSRPRLKPWDVVGWAWYFAHRRSIAKER